VEVEAVQEQHGKTEILINLDVEIVVVVLGKAQIRVEVI
jgi:hypothetical protein